jgi:putative transcriptional regulator
MSLVHAGNLLIATPMLGDPNFARTVIYLVEHGEQGSLGFIVNRPLDSSLGEVWETCPEHLQGLRCCGEGGPVHRERGLLIHGYRVSDAAEIGSGLFVGGDIDQITNQAQADPDIPARGPRLLLGHSGWDGDQLAGEIAYGAWLVRPGDPRFLLNPHAPEDFWENCLAAGRPGAEPSAN